MIFITSDLHFGHIKEFLYKSRGFRTIYEHDLEIVKRWNSVVKEEDEVYCLGDMMLYDNAAGAEYIKSLNGKIHIIIGNHDTEERIKIYRELPNVVSVDYGARLKHGKYRFFLSHYPTLCANLDDGKALGQHIINLCGHTHTKDPFWDWDKGLIYHVELDAHDCYPISVENIIKDCKEHYES